MKYEDWDPKTVGGTLTQEEESRAKLEALVEKTSSMFKTLKTLIFKCAPVWRLLQSPWIAAGLRAEGLQRASPSGSLCLVLPYTHNVLSGNTRLQRIPARRLWMSTSDSLARTHVPPRFTG